MVASVRHGQPLILGYTGYPPPHDELVRDAAGRLGLGYELADLVDMTHLRWILLRPVDEWPLRWQRSVIRHLPGVTTVLAGDGFELLRVDLEPAHPSWFEALRQPRAGTSLLGTPLRPLVAPRGAIELAGPLLWPEGRATVAVPVLLHNTGGEDWPAARASDAPDAFLVDLAARLERRRFGDLPGETVWTGRVALNRDVPAGESVAMHVHLVAPPEPGEYTLRLELQQEDVGAFDPATSPPLEVALPVGS
jgi:hypothetical protein